MVRKFSNDGHVMSIVIMHPSALREKRNKKEDLDQEDLETSCMLMKKKKKKKNPIKT